VSEFREFARLPPPHPRPVDVHRLIDETLDLYRGEPDLEISRDYARDLPSLLVDPDQIRRALHNVVGNAIEAMRGAPGSPERRLLEVRSSREDGMALIEIADRGPGLPEDGSARIFEPEFTTKPGGTGLGMAITQRIVSEHGGFVGAHGRPGGGTCVAIRLPLAGPGPTGG
jgi:signal transduction histidine kinase